MKYRFSKLAAVAALGLGVMLPNAALANTSESDWTLTTSISASSYDSNKTLAFNASRCRALFDQSSNEVSFVFTLGNTAGLSSNAQFSLKYAKGSESCATKKLERDSADACENITNNQVLTASTTPITVKRKVSELSSASTVDMCENLSETAYLYLIVSDSNTSTENIYTVTYVLNFRTTRPGAPTGLEATPGGSSISLDWDAVDNATSYKVYYVEEGGSIATGDIPDNLDAKSVTVAKTSATLKDGINEETNYIIGVTALDKMGNESLVGDVVTAQTVASKSFWDSYREENADVDGGFCFIATAAWGSTQEPHVALLRQFRDDILMQSDAGRAFVQTYYRLSPPLAHFIGQHAVARAVTRTLLWPLYGSAWLALHAPFALGGIALALVGALAMLLRKRKKQGEATKKKNLSAVKTTTAALLLASVASLAAPSDAIAKDQDDESPVNMMFEFKGGMYAPKNLGDAFDKHFGDNSGFNLEIEYDWQFWRGVGSLGLGFHFGYGNISGSAVDDAGETTVDSTVLHWIPCRLSLIYRFDYLWQRFSFPITLYVKAGFDYVIWLIKDGADDIASSEDGAKGYGGTFGFHVVGGLAIVLDWFAPSMAKSFDVEWGVNNSYIFVEYMYANINSFYTGGVLDLTDYTAWHVGIGIEF